MGGIRCRSFELSEIGLWWVMVDGNCENRLEMGDDGCKMTADELSW